MLNRVLDFFRPKRAPAESRCDSRTFNAALDNFPALQVLSEQQLDRLQERAAQIMQQKTFLGGSGYEPSREDRLSVALLAALPVLRRGLDWYQDFHTFVLYPEAFVTELDETDDDGLVHSGQDLRVGEAWSRGPVILAMSDVHASGQGDGFNVVVHELAHQIDHRNGEANGFPPLPDGMQPATWTRVFSAAYDRLLAELERGEETGLDPYAAESPAEFFAVASECFFDAPRWLSAHHPDIHRQLVALYGYSP
ncbi:zinc-dependent peptidase [Wenzhouxiangella limi]|uniref:Zinc-dependent peptidase n=1 Tax=Wenzhouxiangella limi TaxID=2707351 RepID=A0A845UXG7_9GAMM|nr:M90 family metallopeptidase [Wenzhouxiangella limi]NDY96117.1 zinc-dependent peptidase [Wenzhouxiangella limi]